MPKEKFYCPVSGDSETSIVKKIAREADTQEDFISAYTKEFNCGPAFLVPESQMEGLRNRIANVTSFVEIPAPLEEDKAPQIH